MENTKLKSFKDLEVWKKSTDLAVSIYKTTNKFPHSELYGIVNQMRRAVISISSNLAEGFKRNHSKEKLQFYNVAYASASELESQIEVSYKLSFLNKVDYEKLVGQIIEIGKMINGLIKSLNSKFYILNSGNKGFTLIELLVSIGIIAILASVGFINLYGYFQRKNLDLLGQEITAVLRNAQNNSISQEQSEQWGVHFENTTSTDDADFYVLFYGASYAVSTSSQKSVLSSGTGFTNPPAGMSFDVIFAPATGITTSTVISIVGTSAGTVKDIVIKNTGGVVDNLEEGLVGYWHFDEGTGHATTTDASGYENTGTLTNSPTWTSGASCKSGGCISFDGSNNYVNAGNGASLNIINAITINSWFKINSQPSSGSWFVMIDKGVSNSPPKGYIVQYYNDGVNYRLESGYVSSGGYKIPSIIKQLNIGEWYNIIWVHDTTNDRDYFYLNGINQSFSYRVGSYVDVIDLSSAINLTIGISSIITKPFNGLIDDVRVYNRALSATEVLKLYNDFK